MYQIPTQKVWNHVNKKLKSTNIIPALNLGHNQRAKTDRDKARALSNFSNSVFHKERPESFDEVDSQEQQILDDLTLTK